MKITVVFLILMIALVGYQPLYQVSGIGNLSSDKLTDIKADISSFRMIRPEFSNNPPVYGISNNSGYEMVNLFNAHELVKNITGSSNMGEGVTIAVIDTGIINHSTFKYYPDEDGNPDNSSLRSIEYIDINHYYASNGSTIYTTDYFTISNESMWSYNIDYEEDNAPVFNNPILNQYQRLGVHDQKNTTHGSLVLGVLLAIAPYASYIVIDVTDYISTYFLPEFYKKITLALESLKKFNLNPDIITTSLGKYNNPIDQYFEANLSLLLEDNTTIMFAASGNDANTWDCETSIAYPAAYSSVQGVGAVVSRNWGYFKKIYKNIEPDCILQITPKYFDVGERADFSRFSNIGTPLLHAPGIMINTVNGTATDGFSLVNGTSFSAPMVAGGAALVIQAFTSHFGFKPKSDLLLSLLKHSDPGGSDTDSSTSELSPWGIDNDPDEIYGYGILDLYEAVNGIGNIHDIFYPAEGITVSGIYILKSKPAPYLNTTKVKYYIDGEVYGTLYGENRSTYEVYIVTYGLANDAWHTFTAELYEDHYGDIRRYNDSISLFVHNSGGGGGGGCVAKWTRILLADGIHFKFVQHLNLGDEVLGFNTSSGESVPVTITGIESTTVTSLMLIVHNLGTVRVTPENQPIWMRNSTYTGWLVDPRNLAIGDEIFHVPTNSWVRISNLIEITGSFEVYDIFTDPLNVFIGNSILMDRKEI